MFLDALQHGRPCQPGVIPNVSKEGPIDRLTRRRVDPTQAILKQFPLDDPPQARPPPTLEEDDQLGGGNTKVERPLIGPVHNPRIVGYEIFDDGVPLVRGRGDPAGFPECGIQMNDSHVENPGQASGKVRFTGTARAEHEYAPRCEKHRHRYAWIHVRKFTKQCAMP
jgi:hypothetical protein